VHAPRDRAIHAIVGVPGLVVAVEGLLGGKSAGPGAIGRFAGEFAGSAGVRTAVGGYMLVAGSR